MGGFTFRLSGHLTFGAVVEWWQVWQGWSSRLGNYRLRATPGAWPKQLCVCVCVCLCAFWKEHRKLVGSEITLWDKSLLSGMLPRIGSVGRVHRHTEHLSGQAAISAWMKQIALSHWTSKFARRLA